MKSYFISLGKWLFFGGAGLIATALLVIAALIYSPVGVELLALGAQKALPSLSIGNIDGSIGSLITAHDVVFRDDQNHYNLEAKKLSVALDVSCLLEPAVCIDSVQASGVQFNLSLSKQDGADSASQSEQWSSPLPIDIDAVELNDITINIDDSSIYWHSLVTGVNWENNEIHLSPSQWQGLIITLPKATDQISSALPANKIEEPIFKGLQLTDIRMPVNFSVPNFIIADAKIIRGERAYTLSSLNFGGSTRNSDIELVHLQIKTPEVQLSADGRMTLQGDYPLAINLAGHYLTAPLKEQSFHVRMTGSLADLALSVVAEGPFKVDLNGQLGLTQANLPFAINTHQLRAHWPLTGTVKYGLTAGKFQAQGTLQGYRFDFAGLLRGDGYPELAAKLQGAGTLTSVDLENMEVKSAGSNIRGELHADWQQDVKLATKMTLDNFKPELFLPQATGTLSGEVVAKANILRAGDWDIDVTNFDIKGLIKNYPLAGTGQLRARSASTSMGFTLSTPGLVISHGVNLVSLSGSLTDSLDLGLDIHVSDLAKSIDHAAGRLSGNVQITGTPESPYADVNLSAANLRWQNILQVDKLSVRSSVASPTSPQGRLDVNLSSENLRWQDIFQVDNLSVRGSLNSLTSPQGRLDAFVDSGLIQGQNIDSIQLTLAGSVSEHSLALSVATPEGTGTLHLRGGLSQAYSSWLGVLSDTRLSRNGETLTLQDEVSINADFTNQIAKVGSHCWTLDGASLCLVDRTNMSAEKVSAAVSLKSLSLSSLTRWMPEVPVTVQGMLEGTANIYWQQGQEPSIDASIHATQGAVSMHDIPALRLGWNSIDVQTQLSKGTLTSTVSADLAANGNVYGRAVIADVKAKDKQLQGRLQLERINIDFLKPVLGENNHLQAMLNADLQLSGGTLHPLVTGLLTVDDVKATGDMFPVAVKGGNLGLNFTGYTTTLGGLIQTPDGDLNVTGDANWQDLSKWTVTSHVAAVGLDVNVPPMVKIKVIPDIVLHLTPGNARVEGWVKIPEGLIEVEDLPELAVAVSKDQVIVDANGRPVKKQTLPFRLESNIEVQIGDALRISAFGLKGRLHGLLKIVQKDDAPFVTGDVNILEGTYRSLGQDLIIQQGNVMFNGPVSKPYVAITAIRNPERIEDDVTAGLKVTGPADSPQISVFSDPAMAQANALSYVLRGKNLGSDGGDNSMTMALIGLSLAQSGHLVGILGESVGIQDLELDTAGSGDDSQVTVSGYVLPGLKVKYGVGLFNSVGEFTLRYRLVKNFYVEAVSGLSSAVDLIYQFEF